MRSGRKFAEDALSLEELSGTLLSEIISESFMVNRLRVLGHYPCCYTCESLTSTRRTFDSLITGAFVSLCKSFALPCVFCGKIGSAGLGFLMLELSLCSFVTF